eukprot:394162_1
MDNCTEETYFDEEITTLKGKSFTPNGGMILNPRSNHVYYQIKGQEKHQEYDKKDQLLFMSGYFKQNEKELNILIPTNIQNMIALYWDSSSMEQITYSIC